MAFAPPPLESLVEEEPESKAPAFFNPPPVDSLVEERPRLPAPELESFKGLARLGGVGSAIEKAQMLPGKILYGAADLLDAGPKIKNFVREKILDKPPEPPKQTLPQAWLKYYSDREKQLSKEDAALGLNDVAGQLTEGVTRAAFELPVQIAAGAGAATEAAAVKAVAAGQGVIAALTQYAQDRGEGKGKAESAAYGTASGLITGLTTKAFGATGVESIFRKEGVKGVWNRVLAAAKDAGFEGLEESADQVQQDLLERITRNPDKPIADTLHDVLLAGSVGTIIGGAVSGVGQIARNQKPPDGGTPAFFTPPPPVETDPNVLNVDVESVNRDLRQAPPVEISIPTQRSTRNRLFESDKDAFGRTMIDRDFAFRVTGQSQIDDIIETGKVRAREGKMRGGRRGETHWTRGRTGTFPAAESDSYVLQTKAEGLNDRQGAIPVDELTAIWKNGKDILPEIKARIVPNKIAQPEQKPSEPTAKPPEISSKLVVEPPVVPVVDPIESFAKEIGWTVRGLNGGSAFAIPTPGQLAAMSPEDQSRYAKLIAAQGKTWDITDMRENSPTKGLTFYVPENATPQEMKALFDAKIAQESASRKSKEIGGGPTPVVTAPVVETAKKDIGTTSPIAGEQIVSKPPVILPAKTVPVPPVSKGFQIGDLVSVILSKGGKERLAAINQIQPDGSAQVTINGEKVSRWVKANQINKTKAQRTREAKADEIKDLSPEQQAQIKSDSVIFEQLVAEHAAELGWAPGEAYDRNTAMQSQGVENNRLRRAGVQKAMDAIGHTGQENSLLDRANALPKLQEFLARRKRFQEATDGSNSSEKIDVTVAELKAGETLTIDGWPVKVESVNKDYVTLDGGQKFGRQEVAKGETLYVEGYEPKAEPVAPVPKIKPGQKTADLIDSAARDVLSLSGETGTDVEKAKAEKAKAAADKAEAKRIEDEQQQKLFEEKPDEEAKKEEPKVLTDPFANGAKVRVGKSPQINTIIRETTDPRFPDERIFEVQNDKTGDKSEIDQKALTPIKERTPEERAKGKGKSRDELEAELIALDPKYKITVKDLSTDEIRDLIKRKRRIGTSIEGEGNDDGSRIQGTPEEGKPEVGKTYPDKDVPAGTAQKVLADPARMAQDLQKSGELLRATSAEIAKIFSSASNQASRLQSKIRQSLAGRNRIRVGSERKTPSVSSKARVIVEENPETQSASGRVSSEILAHRLLFGSGEVAETQQAGQGFQQAMQRADFLSKLFKKLSGLRVVIHRIDAGGKKPPLAQYRPSGDAGFDVIQINSNALKNYDLTNPESLAALDAALTEELLHAASFRVSSNSELAAVWNSLTPKEKADAIEAYGESAGNDAYNGAEYVRMILQERLTGETSEKHRKVWRLTNELKLALQRIVDFLKREFGNKSQENIARQIIERIEAAIKGEAPIEQSVFEGGEAIRSSNAEAAAFYSRLTRTVENSPQGKASGAQWKATIRNSKIGANADEMALVGVNDLEDGKAYTKAEVLDYLKANEVVVKDVTLGNPDPDDVVQWADVESVFDNGPAGSELMDEFVAMQDDNKRTPKNALKEFSPQEQFDIIKELNSRQEGLGDSVKSSKPARQTRFAAYQLPGAVEGSYREVMLTLPDKAMEIRNLQENLQAEFNKKYGRSWSGPDLSVEDAARWRASADDPIGRWRDGHAQYSSIANPIVRLRLNERVTSDGKRMIFLEEVQAPQKGQFEKMPALFQKNWREIAFKWALRHAAENGFDSVGWTTGRQQADRYSLSKQVSHEGIRWSENPDKTIQLYAQRADTRGVLVNKAVTLGGVENYAGKDVARQISESLNRGATMGEITGENLDLGGEGLKKLYDSDFRNVVNNLPAVKKAGQKVGTEKIGTGDKPQFILWGDQPSELDVFGRIKDFQRVWDGPGRTAAGWQNWNVNLDRQASEVHAAMVRRQSYADAMNEHGSIQLSDKLALGGEWQKQDVSDSIHSLTLTPAIRESVMGGQAIFTSIGQPIRTSIQPEGETETKKQQEFGAAIGEDQEIENVRQIQTALNENGYALGDTVTPESTDKAWDIFTGFVNPSLRSEKLAQLRAVVPQEMAPGILQSMLWQYAVRLAATGEPQLFRAMAQNSNQFIMSEGPAFRSTFGRGLRALRLGADFTTWKNELERSKQQRKAIAERLGVAPDLIDLLVENLNGARPDIFDIPVPETPTQEPPTEKEIDDEASEEQAKSADQTAAEILRRLELDYAGVDWLKRNSKPRGIIQQILREFYRGKDPILPIEGNANRIIEELSARFVEEAGVSPDIAQKLANAAEVKRQTDWNNVRAKAINRAKNSRNLRTLIDDILATPYLAQSDPQWLLNTAENWFLSNGLSKEQAKGAATLFQTEFRNKLLEAQTKIVERLLTKAQPKNRQQLIDAIRAGLFDPDTSWAEIYAEKAGMRTPTKEQSQKLAQLELELQGEDLTAPDRAEVIEQMMGIYLHLKLPPSLLQRIASNFIVTNLTGLRTATVNIFAPIARLTTERALATVANPLDFANNIKTLVEAYKHLLRRAQFSLTKDAYTFINNEFEQASNDMRRVWENTVADLKSKQPARQSLGLLKGLYGSQQFYMRMLNSLDQANAVTEREVQLVNYGSTAFRMAGLDNSATKALVEATSRLKRAAYEDATERLKLSPDRARVHADEVVFEQLEAFIAERFGNTPEAWTKARKARDAAEKDAYSAIGRLAPGIKETDEGGLLSRVFYHPLLDIAARLRRGKGADPILGVSLLGYVSIPVRTARFIAWNSPYGLLRLGINKFRKSKGWESWWKQSLANEYQERHRLKMALAGTAVQALLTGLGMALLKSSSDDDAGDDELALYVTGKGPKNKNLKDEWQRSGFRENSLVFFWNKKPITVPMTRLGEPLSHLFWILSARDDYDWRKREKEASGQEFKETWNQTTGNALGTYVALLGQRGVIQNIAQWAKIGSGEGGTAKVLADLGSRVAASATIPWLGMQRSVIGATEGQLDRSSVESAAAANFGIPGVLLGGRQAVNRFGDPLGNRTWYGIIGDTGVPLAFQTSPTQENQTLYRTLAQKGAAAPQLRRYILEEKYGDLTDDQFESFALKSGALLKQAVVSKFAEVKNLTPEQTKEFLSKAAQQADRIAASTLGLTRVKPVTRAEKPIDEIKADEILTRVTAPPKEEAPASRTSRSSSRSSFRSSYGRRGRSSLASYRTPRLRSSQRRGRRFSTGFKRTKRNRIRKTYA